MANSPSGGLVIRSPQQAAEEDAANRAAGLPDDAGAGDRRLTPAVTIEPAPPEPEPAASVPPGDPPVPRENAAEASARRRPRWKGATPATAPAATPAQLAAIPPARDAAAVSPFGLRAARRRWPAGWRNCSPPWPHRCRTACRRPARTIPWTRPAGTSRSAGDAAGKPTLTSGGRWGRGRCAIPPDQHVG